MSSTAHSHVAFDIGGTFTDVSLVDGDGVVRTVKLLSVMADIGPNVRRFAEDTLPGQAVGRFVHGTTTCSNAIIEATTVRTGLLTTSGFRDILEFRGQRGPSAFVPDWKVTAPLVPRQLREEIEERVRADGTVSVPLDGRQARAAIRRLLDCDVQAIGVCLLNSYENPAHELQLKRLVAELAPDVACCISAELDPEIKEYERTSTTVINASLTPVVRDYVARIRESLDQLCPVLLIMQSNGGLVSADAAVARPAYLMESGPAAGVLAAAKLARESGLSNAISFDMGGTTAKACLIENGVALEKAGTQVGPGSTAATGFTSGSSGEGHALRIPSLDIVEVGTGGGSLAWVDAGGALRVGPTSAAADPGPACYGRGGLRPTVTDANLVLGYLNPTSIANATIALDRAAAVQAITEHIANPLGLSLHEAALGIVRVCNATMVRALRSVSTERGKDPRRCALIGFGGAGPVHAVALAEVMGMDEVHIPLNGGVFSSIGLLLADLRADELSSVSCSLSRLDGDDLAASYVKLEHAATAQLLAQGASADQITCHRFVDVRYQFQVSAETLPVSSDVLGSDLPAEIAERHDKAYEQQYGHVSADPVIVVNLRIRGTAPAGSLSLRELNRHQTPVAPAAQTQLRAAYFGGTESIATDVYAGSPPARCFGPAVIELADTTILIPPGWTSQRSPELGSFVLRRVARPDSAEQR